MDALRTRYRRRGGVREEWGSETNAALSIISSSTHTLDNVT
jgi:hypothetical protein